jgi:hypothetical protein
MRGSVLHCNRLLKRGALLCALAIASVAFVMPARAIAANAIGIENQKAGTPAWQIGLSPYKISNDTDLWIRGYASATSINKGQKITFNITVNPYSWKAGPVAYYIDVYRVGWYGGAGGRLMQHLGPFTGVQQPGGTSAGGVTSPGCPYDPATGMIACQWTGDGLGKGSYVLDTSLPTLNGTADWTSGIYLALLTTSQSTFGPQGDPDHQSYIIFAIREDSRTSGILFQQAVATYQAYNNYPDDGMTGKSFYGGYGSPTTLGTQRAVKVSFDRPYTDADRNGAGLFLEWELYFVRWLERNGYDVTYQTDVDTHANPGSLLNHTAVVLAGHSEYWSAQMRSAFETARDSGTFLGFFGANTLYSQIRFESSPRSGVANRVIVGYKDSTLDPVNIPGNPSYNPALTTVPWRNSPVNNAEQRTLGTMYIDYFDATLAPSSYIVQNSGNWVYAGTGFTNGTTVSGILGYEMDAQFLNYSVPAAVPGTYTLLSSSPFRGANVAAVANSSIYQAAAGPGAWVFNAGTIYWSLGLDSYVSPTGTLSQGVHAGAPNAGIQQTTANFLNLALGSAPAAPGNLTATAVSSSGINLTWTDNVTNANAMLVENSTNNINFTQIASLAGTATSYSSTGLTAGTLYYYRVRAQNASGTTAYSNTASATTSGGAVPAAPGNVAAGQDTTNPTSQIDVYWQDNSNNETGFEIFRSVNNVTFTQVATVGANVTEYSDTGLASSTQYWYYVKAYNASAASAASNTDSTITAAGGGGGGGAVPAAPSNVAAGQDRTNPTSQIDVYWQDNSNNETGFEIFRSTDNVTFTQVATVGANVTEYSNTGLASNTRYWYYVKSYNGSGTSAASNTDWTVTAQ